MTTTSDTFLSPFWRRTFRHAIWLALVLTLIAVAMRALATLGGREWSALLPLGFVLMMAMPWIFLTPEGRRRIGFRRATQAKWYVIAAITGGIAASACYGLGVALFDHGADNWFVSVANSYRGMMNTASMDLLRLHLIFTIPALLFSPIGEEIFFRGFLQEALQEKFSTRASTIAEAGLFGVVHLCHHGLFVTATGLGIRPLSGALWVVLMFSAALLFAWLRRESGSLYPAMLGHATFNLVMNVWIFSMLWP